VTRPPDRRRVDAHVHLWDYTGQDWLAAPELAPLRRSFGYLEYATLAHGTGVVGAVLVATGFDPGENRRLLALARHSPLVRGVVAALDPARADVPDRLAELRDLPGAELLVGVRHQVQEEPDPAWMARPEVVRGLRAVAAAGLTYDLLIRVAQLPAAVQAVRAVPELRVVLDHLAKPLVRSGSWEPWFSGVCSLARCPNVVAKVSGLVTEASWADWTLDDLAPYVDAALAVFGPGRLMLGSDWPVCTLAASFADIWGVADELLDRCSEQERAEISGRVATRTYELASEPS
jgi:L-fuconolactonase